MHRIRRSLLLAAGIALFSVSPARAQLLPSFSVKVGAAVPVHNDSDILGNGVHVGAALKLPILPLQIEGAMDRLGGKEIEGTAFESEDETIWSVGAAIPITIAPPLSPVAPYLIGGGGLYKSDESTDVGFNAGAGLRVGVPGFKPFVEGRGVLILADGNKLTYVNIAVGLRF
jgi:hypothetical protein